jgi:hypothetical protein
VAIIDRREIEFDLNAVKLALEWSPNAAHAFGLPPRTPQSVRCRPAESTIEVVYGQLTSMRVFTLRAEALGAILISYCNRLAMPLPRTAEKAIRIEQEHVVIVLTLRMPAAPQPEEPEGPVNRIPDTVRVWSWIDTDR